ncbi:putative beta-D-xylosidase 5 [Sesamum alatum]|uniref:Beta-D-xylosidase 5 n=1 Tax=Sesamum alatum TaxID=300844 RepID=A0AAE1Z1I8_9LAMI|nr:putative beta-D-xylosidase 5 [Sesamum alatum]
MKDFAFCNSSLSYEVRVKDLIDRMTLNEKSAQIGDTANGVPRIGLLKYERWSEALHGVSNVGQWNSIATYFDDVVPGATSFPTVILTAASFNQTLWKTVGQVKALETPGEDPYVVGEYAVNYVRGLQDVEGTENATDLNSRPLKVGACCKHCAAYDVDNWLGVDRYHFDARVTEQDMQETFLRPFEMCVKEGDVTSVMCSYNKINGIPACADPKLLKDTLYNFSYIVSDCDSIEVMLHGHKWLDNEPEDAAAQALKAGYSVRMGKVKEAEIDSALKNLYTVLMRLGFFDGSPKFENLGKSDVCSNEHIELATDAARQGIVLLKKDAETLPLSCDKIKTIVVIGPHINATSAMIGNYASVPCRYTSPIDGLSEYGEVI